MSWQVLYLRPKSEKKMGRICDNIDIEYYLPLRKEAKVYQRRQVVVHKPVFPGYFFLSLDGPDDKRSRLTDSKLILKFMRPEKEQILIDQLTQVRMALTVDPSLGATKHLAKGKKVRIITGPFQGITGIIENLRGSAKVILNVDIIGQCSVFETSRNFIQVIDD